MGGMKDSVSRWIRAHCFDDTQDPNVPVHAAAPRCVNHSPVSCGVQITHHFTPLRCRLASENQRVEWLRRHKPHTFALTLSTREREEKKWS